MNTSLRKFTRAGTKSCAILAVALLASWSTPALAIPSPDLVINLSASVAQLLGLLSVVFGGFAMKKRGKKKSANKGLGRMGKALLTLMGIVLVASLASNALQFTASIDDKNRRLQTNLVRKSTENGKAVGDVSLKTLSFSDQKQHPQGITTDDLANWLAADESLTIIDVREDEEFESGSIANARHVRYPDLLANPSLLAENSNTLLLCYSGNRSSELCTGFTEQGHSCNFMVGGYEKWLSESRPLGNDVEITSEQLRALPDFANKELLLDTPEVTTMVAEEGAQFIDVRYPGEFEQGHLPGAINLTMRALQSDELSARISQLPDTPLIAACYDKRSCFYSQLVGLRMDRAGKDFRGRYTVPHEYVAPNIKRDREHVEAWKEQQGESLGGVIITPLRAVLDTLVDKTGHYALGLLLLVVLVRLIMLPLSLKAERDTVVQKSLSGRISDLKNRYKDHPRALTDATMKLYKQYKIRPIINVLASVGQLGFMLLFFSAVQKSAPSWPHAMGWIEVASNPDPLYVFPLAATVLFIGMLALQSPPNTWLKRGLYIAGTLFMGWLLFSLSAAANLYLIISLTFLIAQSLLFKAIGNALGWSTAGHDKTGSIPDTGLIPLSKAHYLPDSTGKKAARLGQLIEAGYNVPGGFVFTSQFNEPRKPLGPNAPVQSKQQALLDTLWKKTSAKKVAVRSSGVNEDGDNTSFAGVYESILNVDRASLLTAVHEVYDSLCSERSAAYTAHTSGAEYTEEVQDFGGVVVQKMVPAQYAGVMFTEHPSSAGAMMVEMVSGLGEDLVSGTVTPDSYAFGKLTGTFQKEVSECVGEPPINMEPLLALGRELETLFGCPQDIEWAFAKGKFYLLQARDITRSITKGDSLRNNAERERSKLLAQAGEVVKLGKRRKRKGYTADTPVFVQSELSELLPRPTPLSADMMSMLWESGGSTDIACEELGIPYKVTSDSVPYITTVFGWTYVNRKEEARRLGKGPGAMASFDLARNAELMEQNFREDFLPDFLANVAERDAIAFDRLSIEASVNMLTNWINQFVEETYKNAELINIAADYHTKTAVTKLTKAQLKPAQYLADVGETVVSRAMDLLKSDDVDEPTIREFIRLFGHRAPLDYELSQPRFSENRAQLNQYISRSSHGTGHAHAPKTPLPDSKVLRISVDRAQSFQRLKEEAKHFCLMELAQIRNLLLSIDSRLGMNGQIFFLEVDEIKQLAVEANRQELYALSARRQAAAEAWKGSQLPAQLSVNDLESIDMVTGTMPGKAAEGSLNGKRVSGDSIVTSTARVIVDIADVDSFQDGEILIARMTDPTWYPLFSRARGIVTEVGGWLSHAAIVAREYDLPAIVGVNNVCNVIKTGDVLTLNMDGSIEILAERRDGDSAMREESADQAAVASQHANAETATSAKIYHMEKARRADVNRRVERRAMKAGLTDRRAEARYDEQGALVPDRRQANRIANARSLRAHALKKAS